MIPATSISCGAGTGASSVPPTTSTSSAQPSRSCAWAVVASRETDRDLWWAHTGGGGGNFGVVTRYWLRDERALTQIVGNHGRWCERNAVLISQVADGDDALLDEHLDALSDGVGSSPVVTRERLPWLTAALKGTARTARLTGSSASPPTCGVPWVSSRRG